jgi:CubicO group peptidase (beta-lactamase class C family)
MGMRRVLIGVVLVAALVIAAFYAFGGDMLIRIASGATSQNICSKTFVSGIAADEVYAQDMQPEPGMGLIDWALRYHVDSNAKSVRTSLFGSLFQTVSIYRDGYGCALAHEGSSKLRLPPPNATDAPALLPPIAGAEIVVPGDAGLRRALDNAFAEPASGPRRWTQAVVVVHAGRVIAERYAPGYGVDTPLLSHSIAKSVMNALVGILAREGKLSASSIAPIAHWQSDGDAGDAVSVDQLLRMSSGLPLDEGIGPGPSQRMWFVEPDTAKFALAQPLTAAPGSRWAYSNLGYAVLSRMVGDAIGGGPAEIAAFAQRELFAPLGMRHAVMEFDGAGTVSGSNAMFATAREWAQFGLLYLNDGVVGGRRMFPEGWASYSAKPTLDTAYGAGFWLNNPTSKTIPVWDVPWGMPGAPADAYFARGYLGQYVVIIPSEKLVIVRFGSSHSGGGDIKGTGALVREVIASLHRPS